MNFVLDQGVPRSTVDALAKWGLNAIHVGQLGMSTAPDDEILQYASKKQRVVVTMDADFHALLAIAGAKMPSLIRIRIEGLKSKDLAELLSRVVQAARVELEKGAAVTVTNTGIRVWRLPLP